MTTLAYLLATVLTAADVSCAEGSHDWREVDAVLQVARNRSEATGRTLLVVLHQPRQFAHACPPQRLHWRHFWSGARMLVDALDVPAWLRDGSVRWFCTRAVAWKWFGEDVYQWSRNIEVAGELRHLYWRLRS